MANKTQQIRIESILGGQSPVAYFAAEDQFRSSIGIDPAQPIADSLSSVTSGVGIATGLLRPTGVANYTGTMGGRPQWLATNPKNALIYAYDASGSAYSVELSLDTFTALSDGGALSAASGNGMAYYDNYIYFAKNTTIARYGPLDGTPAFNGDYWVTTLAKTSLTNTTYPTDNFVFARYPNHVMHRHSDGKLYFADVVGNQGVVHSISTTKTTVEGDTDAGSTYNALDFGYGLWPTAIETYGSSLAVALYEGPSLDVDPFNNGLSRQSTAKLAFWDTTSANFNSIIFVEFPDQIISALKNVNGILYIVSGNPGAAGFRVSRYVGGTTIQEVAYFEQGQTPFAGAVDGTNERLLFGSFTYYPEASGCVYSLGLQKSSLGQGTFNIMRPATSVVGCVYSLLIQTPGFGFNLPVIGWTDTSTTRGLSTSSANLNNPSTGYASTYPSVWQSRVFSIGQRFKITKVRIPLANGMSSGMIVTPKIYVDDGSTTYTGGSTNGLSILNNTNYSGKRVATMRPEGVSGQNNFWLELRWTGSALCVVGLPIVIEYELLDD